MWGIDQEVAQSTWKYITKNSLNKLKFTLRVWFFGNQPIVEVALGVEETFLRLRCLLPDLPTDVAGFLLLLGHSGIQLRGQWCTWQQYLVGLAQTCWPLWFGSSEEG